MSYTDCKIGGVDVWIDPESITEDVTPYGAVIPSLDGTMFVKYLNTNPANIGSLDRLTISGIYLITTSVSALRERARARTLVSVTGVPGLEEADKYFITAFNQAPIKPAVIFPGDSWSNPPVRHSYNMSLTKVTAF
jgi:hypothetical protein